MAAYLPELQNEFGTGSSAGTAALKEISKDGFYTMTDPHTGQTVESLWRGSSYNFDPRLDGRQLLWWDGQYHSYSAQKNNQRDLYRTGGQTNVNFALVMAESWGLSVCHTTIVITMLSLMVQITKLTHLSFCCGSESK